ncbi:LysR substrate-binding domain-containing protein [Lactobacillus gigeriorum]
MTAEQTIYDILASVKTCRSITDIANRLMLGQPYVSKQIYNAELKYHTKLINRKPPPITLTKAGKIVLASLEKELEIQNMLKLDLSPYIAGETNFIKIGVNQPWITVYGHIIYEQLHRKFPDINFELTEVTSDVAEQKLLTRDIDISCGKLIFNTTITSKESFALSFYFLIPENSSLYSSNKENYLRILTKDDLIQFNNQNLISLTDDSFFQKLVDHMLTDTNVHQNKVLKVGNHVAGTNLAIEGAGIFVTEYDFALPWIGKKPFNLIKIPKSSLNFELAVSHRNDASEQIKALAAELYKIELQYQEYLTKLTKK